MTTYTVRPQPKGEDAVRKEVRFILATARAKGERVFKVRHGECAPFLVVLLRQTFSALKRRGQVNIVLPGGKIRKEASEVIYLSEKYPLLFRDPELDGEHDDITLISL